MILNGKAKEKLDIISCKNCKNSFEKRGKKIFCSNKCCDIYHSNKRKKQNKVISLENEVWRDIDGYEEYYQVSNLGRIKSCSRTIKGRMLNEKIKKSSINCGYEKILLYKDSKHCGFTVHFLVAKAFIKNLKNKPCVNHINGIKTDNRVENLEWVTYSENNKHAYDTGLRNSNHIKNNKYKRKRVTSTNIKTKESKIFDSIYMCSLEIGVSTSTIGRILNGKTKNSRNYTFEYTDIESKRNF